MGIKRFLTIFVFGVFFTSGFFLFSPLASQVHAQSSTVTRLYIPVSDNVTLEKEGASEKLIIKDYLSSTRIVQSGGATQNQQYFPYGTSLEQKVIGTDRRFTGHRLLTEAGGVYHAGARFYNPQLGAFIQADKVEGPNRFLYVKGNPTNFADPSGNQAETPPERPFPVMSECTNGSGKCAAYQHHQPISVWLWNNFSDSNSGESFASLAQDKNLLYAADQFINRNPYDPEENKMEFITYLSQDIYQSSEFNPHLRNAWGKERDNKELMNSYFRTGSRPGILENDYDYFVQKGRDLKAEEISYWESHNAMSYADRFQNGMAICEDFSLFTSLTLARAGIKSEIMTISTGDVVGHSYNLFEYGSDLYVLDTSQNGYIKQYAHDDKFGQLGKFSSSSYRKPFGPAYSQLDFIARSLNHIIQRGNYEVPDGRG